MSKKRVNEGLVDKAVSAIFGAVGKQLRKSTLKDLSKKDFPIMYSLVESICKDKKFVINFL